jgi:hypothetical protein
MSANFAALEKHAGSHCSGSILIIGIFISLMQLIVGKLGENIFGYPYFVIEIS